MSPARSLLAVLLAALPAACGTPAKPPAPVPPTVQLLPVPRELLALSLKLTVQATGCDSVATVRLYDRQTAIFEAPATGGTTTVDVPAKAIDFKARGVAADLALFGEAICADGRSAKSNEVPVTFMPAAEVLPGPWPFTNFWAEPDGDTFLSCTREITRYRKDRTVSGAKLPLIFDCSSGGDILFGKDGKRYAWKVDGGIVGFTAAMTELFAVNLDGLTRLTVPDTGDLLAVSYDQISYTLHAYDRSSGKERFATGTNGQPEGNVFIDRQGRIIYPTLSFATGSQTGELGVERYDSVTGKKSSSKTFGLVKTDVLSTTVVPPLSFDSGGDVAYFADLNDPGVVTACDAMTASACTASGGGLKWRSPALAGGVRSVIRLPNTIVALGPKIAYFLDPTSGALIGAAITPTGSLEFSHVLPGADGSITLLSQSPTEAGIKEVVLFDAPGKEAARYVTGSTGYVVDLDARGQALLLGADLVRLLPASEYRKVR